MTQWDGIRMRVRAWRYRHKLDRAEIRFVREHLRPGDAALDIGAHKGGYAYWMCRAVGPAGRVICFEPQPQLADYLRRMELALGFDQLTVENMGVSSTNGELTLHVPGGRPSPGSTLEAGLAEGGAAYKVRVTKLDDYFREHPPERLALVKCDVEGHELDVFRGGQELLRTQRPVVLFECEERHHTRYTSRDVFDYLANLGFEGFFFSRGTLQPLRDFHPSEHGDPAVPGYANNFLFRPRPRQ